MDTANSPLESDFKIRPQQGVILICLLVIAALLRIHALGTTSLWVDETFSLGITLGHDVVQIRLPETGVYDPAPELVGMSNAAPWWHIWTHMHYDNHPPLYIVLLRLWRDAFGSSEIAVRSLSVVVSMIALLGLFDAVRHLHGTTTALWAAAIMAVAIPQIQYAQETRSYVLLVAEGMLALSAIARIERRGPNAARGIGLTLAILSMALTHYFAIGAIAGLMVYALLRFRGRTRQLAIASFTTAFLLGLILWGHELWAQHQSFSAETVAWLSDDKPHPLIATLVRILLLPARFLLDTKGVIQAVSIVAAVVFVLPPLAFRRRPALMLWWIWLVGSIAPVVILDLLHHTMMTGIARYTLLASPAVYALISTSSDYLPKVNSRLHPATFTQAVVCALAVLVCLVAIPRQAYHPAWRADWRGLADQIIRDRAVDEPLCFAGVDICGNWPPDCLYTPLSYRIDPMPSPSIWIEDPPADPPQLQGLHDRRGLWALVSIDADHSTWTPRGWKIESATDYPTIGVLEHLQPVKE